MGAKLPPPSPPKGAAKSTPSPTAEGRSKLPPPSPPKGAAARPAPVQTAPDELLEEQHVEQPAAPAEPGSRRGTLPRMDPVHAPDDFYPAAPPRFEQPTTLLPRTAKLLRGVHEELTLGTLDLAGHPSGRMLRHLIDQVDACLAYPEESSAPSEAAPPDAEPREFKPGELAAKVESAPPEAAPPEAAPPEAAPPEATSTKK